MFDLMMKKFPESSQALPVESKIIFKKVVKRIDWKLDNGAVLLKCQDGSEFQAFRVVVTVSLGVLKKDVNTLFSPSLPQQKLDAINVMYFFFFVILNFILSSCLHKKFNFPGFSNWCGGQDISEICRKLVAR